MGTENRSLLRNALTGNGMFSIVSGLIAAVYATSLGDLMGLDPVVLLVVGVGVIGFGIITVVNARRQPINLVLAKSTVVADIAWVVGAAVVILLPDLLTTEGSLLLGGVSVVVGLFAVVQRVGIRRIGGIDARIPRNGFEAMKSEMKERVEARAD